MTDPSYARQLITFTYPHIGNYGVSAAAMESDRIHARAAIMRDAPQLRGQRRAPRAAGSTGCATAASPAITGVDTRALVRHIRDAGAMRGGIFPDELDARARRAALIAAEPSMVGLDLAREVTPPSDARARADRRPRGGPTIALIDTGVKSSIVAQPARARRARCGSTRARTQRRARSSPARPTR